jgi:polar amino acid transport system substrate-binding protein
MNGSLFIGMLWRVLALVAVTQEATAKPDLLVVTEPVPVFQEMQDGEVSGTNTALVRQILHKAQLKAEFHMYPWARAYNLALNQPDVLIYAIAKTKERERLFHWIGPIAAFKQDFIRLKVNQKAEIKQLADAKALTIAVQRQDNVFGFLTQQGFIETKQLILAADAEQSWSLLANKKVDLIVENPVLMAQLAHHTGLSVQAFEMVYLIPELELEAYLAVSKNTAQDKISKLKHAYQQVIQGL